MKDYTVKELSDLVQTFCEERDWDQFHNPKDLAIGMSTEANELLQIFRFKNEEDMKGILENPEKEKHIQEELADVFFFVLRFAQRTGIDLKEALAMKLEKNARNYPVETAKGSNKKYNER